MNSWSAGIFARKTPGGLDPAGWKPALPLGKFQ